jgi:hypothetical protein
VREVANGHAAADPGELIEQGAVRVRLRCAAVQSCARLALRIGQTTPWSFFVTAASPLYLNFCTRCPR